MDRDKKGKTSLMYACASESSETVKRLIEKGASINARDKLGVTPMMVAASKGKKAHLEVLIQV
jgi:ankyrin repeat protein